MPTGPLPIAVLAALALAFAQSQTPVPLEPEKTFNRNLAAGAADTFTLELKPDQIVELTLEYRGKDVTLSVYSPDGRLSRAFSSERQEGEPLQFLATQPGKWVLKAAARDGNSPATYTISNLKITTPHAPALSAADQSPRIRKVTNQAEADAFWKEIGPNGSPLIEPNRGRPPQSPHDLPVARQRRNQTGTPALSGLPTRTGGLLPAARRRHRPLV
jgi:hypothetical protein